MSKSPNLLLSCVSLLSLAGFEPAWAAPAAADSREADSAPASGEITVTARRREERLQDVPVAITAISGSDLAKSSITKTEDLMHKTPGLTVQPSSFGKSAISFGIRSQRQYLAYMTVDQSVGVYQDEVYQSRTNGLNSLLFDLESVQVLKGPQGTLFGRNTPGGAILFTSRKPNDEFGGYIRATAGNYNTYRSEAALNVPLSDQFQLRVAGAFNKHDGYTRNLSGPALDDEDSSAYRVSLKFEPSTGFRNLIVVSGMREVDEGQAYKALPIPKAFFDYYTANGIRLSLLAATAPVLAQLASQPFHTVSISEKSPGIDVHAFGLSNTTEIDLGSDILIKNIFGYRHVTSANRFDFDGTPSSLFVSEEDQTSKQYSNELQLQAKLGAVDLIIGGFYFRETGDNRQITNGRKSGGIIKNKSIAGFAQATWHDALVSGLSLTGGIRVTQDDRYYDAQNFATNGTCRIPVSDLDPTVTITPCSLINKARFTEPTWTLTADYRVDPAVMVYATYRRGYRSGGFTFAGTRRAEFTPFKPETVDDIELGLKSNFAFLGGEMRVNAAAYHDKYKDIQRTISEVRNEGSGATTSFPVTLTKNAAAATIKGFEIDARWKPVPEVEISAFWNYSKPEYESFQVTTSGGIVRDYSNNPFSFAPLNTVGAALDVEIPIGNGLGNFELHGDMYYQDVTYLQDTIFDPLQPTELLRNTALGKVPAYTVFNARVDWKNAFEKGVDIAFFVRNLTDNNYFVGGVDLTTAASVNVGMMGAPRTYGVEVGYTF